jgi:hypothetical protein
MLSECAAPPTPRPTAASPRSPAPLYKPLSPSLAGGLIRWDAVGLLKRTAVKLAVRDEAREHWGPSQVTVTDTSQKRHGFNYNKVTLFVPDPVSHHR